MPFEQLGLELFFPFECDYMQCSTAKAIAGRTLSPKMSPLSVSSDLLDQVFFTFDMKSGNLVLRVDHF